MSIFRFLINPERKFGIFDAGEFTCADCDYWSSCVETTEACIVRAAQAKKWRQKQVQGDPMIVPIATSSIRLGG